jgi:ribosomal protein S18 acetylase RimI-like enzyme
VRQDVRIIEAETPALVVAARGLFREYAASLPFSLEYQGFEEELAGLPGKYARPSGTLLLGFVGEELAGSVALRALGEGVCEMKRLYVRPAFRGRGLGLELARRIVEEGRGIGYRAMRLDTSGDMAAAIRVYESLGFRRIGRYNDDPLEDTVFMELGLEG